VRLAAIAVGDIVLIAKGGRQFHARVERISSGVVHFVPIGRGLSYRQATAHEVIDHWRHAGTRAAASEDAPAPGQLSLAGPLDRSR
jgi:hypothetical protein